MGKKATAATPCKPTKTGTPQVRRLRGGKWVCRAGRPETLNSPPYVSPVKVNEDALRVLRQRMEAAGDSGMIIRVTMTDRTKPGTEFVVFSRMTDDLPTMWTVSAPGVGARFISTSVDGLIKLLRFFLRRYTVFQIIFEWEEFRDRWRAQIIFKSEDPTTAATLGAYWKKKTQARADARLTSTSLQNRLPRNVANAIARPHARPEHVVAYMKYFLAGLSSMLLFSKTTSATSNY